MSEMVERVASAIAKADFEWQDTPGAQITGWSETLARAAIEAMRDVPDDQRNAYYKLSGNIDVMMDAHWERAIDAALA